MAWPGTETERTEIFVIFGIPQSGSAFVVGRIISLYGPAGNNYDFTNVVTQLNTLLNLITTTQYAYIQSALTEWTTITDWSEIKVSDDNNSKGQLVDHFKRRRMIRKTLANIIGFFCPEDGFWTDSAQVFAGSMGGGGRVLR